MTTTEPGNFHREWLLRVLASLFSLAGMAPGSAPVSRLPKTVRLAIARALLPAESAGRRLIFFVAQRMIGPVAVPQPGQAPTAQGPKASAQLQQKTEPRVPVFWLFDRRAFLWELSDPRRRVARGPGPRISFFDGSDRDRAPAPKPEKTLSDPDDARRLCTRMLALQRALEDVPAQAQRMRRMMERRKLAPPGPGRYGPVRPGLPPGYRRTWTHEVDGILYDCVMMARDHGPAPEP